MKVKLYYLNELNPLAQVRALANALVCEKSVYSTELNAMRERLKGGYFDIHTAINGLNMEFIRLRNSRRNLARMEQDPAYLRKLVIENHLMFNADGDYYHFHRKRWYRSGNTGKNAK